MADSTDDFYKLHRGGNGRVVVAFLYTDGELVGTGIFSCIESAEAWVSVQEDCDGAVFSPYVVDCPEFGNIPSNLIN